MEIANFIVATLSLIATIVLTVVIYRLQKANEAKRGRERREDIAREIKERNEELARNFIIDNQSEIDLLPWCAIASNVKDLPACKAERPRRKYSHQIYLKFDKQPEAIKREILRQEGILLNLPKNCDWVSEYLERLKIDAFECGMSANKDCFLYEGAKFFHRGISMYWDEKLEDPVSIKIPNIPINREKSLIDACEPEFDDYIYEAIYRKFGEYSKLAENAIPPLDFANRAFHNREKKFVLCMMEFVRSFSRSVRIRTCENEDFDILNTRQVSTYEDYYYEALRYLYLAYS